MDGSSFGRAERFAVGGREGWNLGTGKGRRGRESERGEEGGSSCLSRRALCMHLNTSLSNLSTCQQHMFCKKPLVGARGKKALLPDQRGNAFFSSMQWIFYCWCSVPRAPPSTTLPSPHTYTRCLHFRNLNWGPSRGFTGRVGVGCEGGAPSFSERMKL